MTDVKDWAIQAANRLRVEFGDSACIDTANYQLCSFILAAAQVALKDEDVARRIGELMEPPR